jgi:hypothetical protein
MERDYKFKISQKVKKHSDIGTVYGEVTDYTSDSVFIKWSISSEPKQYFQNEYSEIKLTNK